MSGPLSVASCDGQRTTDNLQSAIHWSGKRVPPPQPPAWRAGALLVELLPGWPARSVSSRRPRALQTHALPLSYRRLCSRTTEPQNRLRVEDRGALPSLHPFTRSPAHLLTWHERKDSNLQLAVLETAALPLSYARVLVELAGFEPAVTAVRWRDVGHATPQLDLVAPTGIEPVFPV
jgi:hypothetical protein